MKQLFLIGTILLSFTACKKDKPAPVPPPVTVANISIEDLKKKSTSASVTVKEENQVLRIKGIVVSDATAKNIDAKSLVLQEGNDKPGIVINFAANHNFHLDDEVQVGVSNQKLEQVNGEIVLNAVPVDSASKTGVGTITPKQTTIAEINTNKAAWNGTLVSIDATAYNSANGKYKGILTIIDASGTISSAVAANAAFGDASLLPSISKVTGIVRLDGASTFLNVRNQNDIVIGSISRVITEDFTVWTNSNTTPNGSYSILASNGHSSLQVPVSAFDPSFTEANKKYPLLVNPHIAEKGVSGYLQTARFLSPGLKKVTVTFAASTAKTLIPYKELTGLSAPSVTPAEFDPSKDVIKIGFSVGRNVESAPMHKLVPIFQSAEFKEVGKWYTVTFNVPTREELITAGASEAMADNILGALAANPQIGIFNLSTRSMGFAGDGTINPFLSAPIIIDKIVYSY